VHPALPGPLPPAHVQLRLVAHERSVGRGGVSRAGTPYNLRLDRLYFGALPATALPLLLTVPLALLLAAVAVRWLLLSPASPLVLQDAAPAAAARVGAKEH
jgi:hypothetical protein